MRSRSFSKNQHAANGGNGASAKGNGGEEGREGRRSGYTLLKRLAPPLVLGVGYALLGVLLLPHQPGMPAYQIGLPSPAKLIASRNFEIADNDRTLALRQKALEEVIPVFREDPEAARKARDKIDYWFMAAQAVTQNPEIPAEQRRQRLAETIRLSPEEHGATVDLLLSYSNYSLLQETLKGILNQTLQNGVVPSHEDWARIQRRLQDGIDVVDTQGNVARRMKAESILDTEQARQKLRRLVAERFNKPLEDEQPRQLAGALLDLVLSPNLVPHESLQQERERAARQGVPSLHGPGCRQVRSADQAGHPVRQVGGGRRALLPAWGWAVIPCACCGATAGTRWVEHPLHDDALPLCTLCHGVDLLAALEDLPPSHHKAARAAARALNALVDAQGVSVRDAFDAALLGDAPPSGTYDAM